MEKQLIDIAYDLAKTKYAKKKFTFKQLWKELVKKARLDEKEQGQVGHVYACMLQDQRFIFVGNDEWKIREFLTLEEQAALSNALYDFSKDEAKTKKTGDDEYGPEFESDEDEEYRKHTEASLDDEGEDEDEIDNESESASEEEDEEEEEEKGE